MNNWYTHEEIKFKLLMRRHMEDHIIWLRSYMVSLLADLPDLSYVEERFTRNHNSLMNCMREFYGDTLVDNLIIIGKDFIRLITDLLKAIKVGDTTNASVIETDLITNVENISNLLSIANPCYSKDELIDLYKTSLILVKYEFIARMSGDYNADIVYFDMLMHHAVTMADYITSGIIERFFREEMMSQYQIQTGQQSLGQEQTQEQQIQQEQYLDQQEQYPEQQEQYLDQQEQYPEQQEQYLDQRDQYLQQ